MGTYTFSGGNGAFGFSMLDWGAGDIMSIIVSVLSSSHSSSQVTYQTGGEYLQARGSLGGALAIPRQAPSPPSPIRRRVSVRPA